MNCHCWIILKFKKRYALLLFNNNFNIIYSTFLWFITAFYYTFEMFRIICFLFVNNYHWINWLSLCNFFKNGIFLCFWMFLSTPYSRRFWKQPKIETEFVLLDLWKKTSENKVRTILPSNYNNSNLFEGTYSKKVFSDIQSFKSTFFLNWYIKAYKKYPCFWIMFYHDLQHQMTLHFVYISLA